jgi:hypothetical protein
MNSPISSWVMAIFTRWADPWKDALHWIDSGDPIFRLKSLYKSVLGWAYQHTNEPRSERQIAISPCNSITSRISSWTGARVYDTIKVLSRG